MIRKQQQVAVYLPPNRVTDHTLESLVTKMASSSSALSGPVTRSQGHFLWGYAMGDKEWEQQVAP